MAESVIILAHHPPHEKTAGQSLLLLAFDRRIINHATASAFSLPPIHRHQTFDLSLPQPNPYLPSWVSSSSPSSFSHHPSLILSSSNKEITLVLLWHTHDPYKNSSLLFASLVLSSALPPSPPPSNSLAPYEPNWKERESS